MRVITVGARGSPLSLKQVEEVQCRIQRFHPHISLQLCPIETSGDKDQTTSLRDLGKTDFFTREIDRALAAGYFQIAVHSAKDLAEQLHPELEVIAYTEALDPSDSLVLPEGEELDSLPSGAVIAASAERRERAVLAMRPDLRFCDIRGTIEKRLLQLDEGRVDGVVIAEAALIRLGLTHLNRITIPGETVERQGQLAIMARANDHEMKLLFSQLDVG